MKKLSAVLLCSCFLCLGAWADWRLELGFDVPKGGGGISDGGLRMDAGVSKVLADYFIPVPEAGIYAVRSFGPVALGAGLRSFTCVVESVYWPNAFLELNLDRLVFEVQAGGILFGALGVYNDQTLAPSFIPDLSVWFRLRDELRLGGGVIAFATPGASDRSFFFCYLGGKAVLPL